MLPMYVLKSNTLDAIIGCVKIKVMENPPMYSLCGNCKGS